MENFGIEYFYTFDSTFYIYITTMTGNFEWFFVIIHKIHIIIFYSRHKRTQNFVFVCLTVPRRRLLGALFVLIHIGQWWCLDHMVSSIDHLNVFLCGIFLGRDACTGAPVTSPFLLKNDCSFGRTPVGTIIPWRIFPLWGPLQKPPGPWIFQTNELPL